MDTPIQIERPTETNNRPLPFWRRNNPFIQNLLISACLFAGPGLYLAITGLGAGGGKPSSISVADTSNGVLYGVFTLSAMVAGPILNILGPRWTTVFAMTGYPLYIGSFWYYDSTGKSWFPILGGAYLGLTAGLLWTTASFICNSYPEEKDKGTWRGIQWSFNMSGGALGSLVALVINWNRDSTSVPVSVYAVFIGIQLFCIIFAYLLLPSDLVIRKDGTHLAEFQAVSVRTSAKGLIKVLSDWRVLVMIPAYFTPEVSLVISSSLNAYTFNLRTRSLNSLMVHLIQIPLALGMGWLLDNEKIGRRRTRAIIGVVIDAVWVTGVYVAQTVWLHSWNFDRDAGGPSIDLTDAAYPGAVVIYLIYGGQYGIFQNVVLWILGSLSNDPQSTALMGGVFVSVLSAGTAVAFGVDASSPPYSAESAGWFGITTICWPILLFIAAFHVTDTNYGRETQVIVPLHARKAIELSNTGDIQSEGEEEKR